MYFLYQKKQTASPVGWWCVEGIAVCCKDQVSLINRFSRAVIERLFRVLHIITIGLCIKLNRIASEIGT
jgi:hypothetical protein